ncbi:MAG TPA: 2,3-epoxybenzoyl-CoA dihydrolase [Burkholderiaceae bacterium]|nr:2,3-epoxybenzoyl-CoA dihydrolase [Burkholderiaceae bacterium]
MGVSDVNQVAQVPRVVFDTHPDRYVHWKLDVDGDIARLTLDVQEDRGLVPGYKLKLNSYDLGVDIELNDALNRIRFEHPNVKCVVVTSGKSRMFCSGANIYMLGQSSHAWKVNFCKFTNETRNGMEDTSAHGGPRFLAAVNGICAGGGYELALACDEILMIDDRSSAVSLPEVPLLGVLPGTGGLTRLVDKRRMRRDLADVFCTTTEGVRAERAREWRLVDHVAKPQAFEQAVREHAARLAATSRRPTGATGVALQPLARQIDESGYRYRHVDVTIDRDARVATIMLRGPADQPPSDAEGARAQGCDFWPLAFARELEDAILLLRHNDLAVGLWLFKSEGDAATVLAYDAFIDSNASHWFVAETRGALRRMLSRLDVSSRSMFTLIEPGSCFVGTLFEIALASDRSYMLDAQQPGKPNAVVLSPANFGTYPMASGISRLAAHYAELVPDGLSNQIGAALSAADCAALGLVTMAPDELDWDDEIRIAIEERASLSPDALTAMEANLRFTGPETMFTRVFGRLSAWQNWVFYRPNATGDDGALKRYGSGSKPKFDWNRV